MQTWQQILVLILGVAAAAVWIGVLWRREQAADQVAYALGAMAGEGHMADRSDAELDDIAAAALAHDDRSAPQGIGEVGQQTWRMLNKWQAAGRSQEVSGFVDRVLDRTNTPASSGNSGSAAGRGDTARTGP